MRRARSVAIIVATVITNVGASPSEDEPRPDVGPGVQQRPWTPKVVIRNDRIESESTDDRESLDDPDAETDRAEMEYSWLPSCGANFPGKPAVTCQGALACSADDEMRWALWTRQIPDGSWEFDHSVCRSNEPSVREEPELKPQVTESVVLRAVRRIGLPSAEIQVQPEGATLVNLRTIFYTEPARMERTVTLLGVEVDIVAEGVEYRWRHGDGTEQISESPGAPYPEMDVTHTFTDAHVTVRPQVDVTYQVQWRVGEGSWRTLDETLTATGPRIDLEIKEATALLTDPYK